MPKKSVIPQKFSKTDNLWVLPKICKSGQSDVGQSVVYYCILAFEYIEFFDDISISRTISYGTNTADL